MEVCCWGPSDPKTGIVPPWLTTTINNGWVEGWANFCFNTAYRIQKWNVTVGELSLVDMSTDGLEIFRLFTLWSSLLHKLKLCLSSFEVVDPGEDHFRTRLNGHSDKFGTGRFSSETFSVLVAERSSLASFHSTLSDDCNEFLFSIKTSKSLTSPLVSSWLCSSSSSSLLDKSEWLPLSFRNWEPLKRTVLINKVTYMYTSVDK